MRLVVFVAAIAGVWVLAAAGQGTAAWGGGAASVAVFALLVMRQRAAGRRGKRAAIMADFNREGVARVGRRWNDLPLPPTFPRERADDHDYASDLDLDGHASLLQLIGVCGTLPGWLTLRRWLLAPAHPNDVALRQEAVLELASAVDFRDRLAAEARLVGTGTVAHPDFALSTDAPVTPVWQRIASWILPPVNITAIALNAMGLAPIPLVGWTLLVSTLVLLPRWKAIHRRFAVLDDGESGVRRYGPLLAHLHRAPLASRMATSIRQRIGGASEHRSAHQEIATLRRLLDMADLRRSPLFHIPLAIVLHWDVHVLAALERWTARCGEHVRAWLDAVGEAEALAALAALTADHPDWTMPSLHPGPHPSPTLSARALGHPLLPPTACVRNAVTIGPPGSFLLVAGSNMSGKSTLLRAVGLNAVLAQAGGPVCAAELHMPPLRVVTSMRVEDSLADGVSRFMAGLWRLRLVVDAARTAPDDRPALYLLDEILQGTNSAERRIAARTVLRHLLDTGAIGAVTTHDLSLADADDLTARAVAVHFTETVARLPSDDRTAANPNGDSADVDPDVANPPSRSAMAALDEAYEPVTTSQVPPDDPQALTFDYRLRPGIATSTNALKLLDMVGLGRE